MESINNYHTLLKELSDRAAKIAAANISLTVFFETERERLKREDEASTIKSLRLTIANELEALRSNEKAAESAYTDIQFGKSTFEFGAFIGSTLSSRSSRKTVESGRDYPDSGRNKPPFGKLAISIGPLGLPEDVKVISTSQISRETKKPESEIMEGMRSRGYLLLTEKVFSQLIERLISEIQGGRQRLPVPGENVSQFLTSNQTKWRAFTSS